MDDPITSVLAAFAGALAAAHARLHELPEAGTPAASDADMAGATPAVVEARGRAGEALDALLEAAGWNPAWLAGALGLDGEVGHRALTRWRAGTLLPPPWLDLALAALAREPAAGLGAGRAESLRDRMDRGGWDASGLADALGVDRETIATWLAGTVLLPGVPPAIDEAERRVPARCRQNTQWEDINDDRRRARMLFRSRIDLPEGWGDLA